MKVDLKADLVVSSARLDGARKNRKWRRNDWVCVGLLSGGPPTVASQWNVETKSIIQVDGRVSPKSGTGKGKVESRQAMLKLFRTKKYNRAFYWAGFVLVGNGR